MRWRTAYIGGHEVDSQESAWEDVPADGLLWVEIETPTGRQTLLGADGYWIMGDAYGVTCDGETVGRHGGHPYYAWRAGDPAGAVLPPPPGAHVVRGAMVPDEEWARLRP